MQQLYAKPKDEAIYKSNDDNIADDCMCGLNNINIKATTTEKLGFIGRSKDCGCKQFV